MRLSLMLVGLLLLTPVTPALALPAPMSEQELVDKSDIVAVVRVLSVSCTAITKDEKTGQELPAYLAKVRLIEVKKGDAQKGDDILVTWRASTELPETPGETFDAPKDPSDQHPL
jgi:hypothetical protein